MKNIENLYSKEEVWEGIREHNDNFDVFDFYLGNADYDYVRQTGFEIITPNQSFNCFCMPYSNYHENLIENIYWSMYDDFYAIFKKNKNDWRATSSELGNICIQMISKYYTLIWLPPKINQYQASQLFAFYDSIKRINDYLSSKGKGIINISAGFKDENGKDSSLSFDEAIPVILNMVSDDVHSDDYIIVEKDEQLGRSLSKRKKNIKGMGY